MFQITFFVDDKNLGEAFKRLAGIARNLQHAYVPNLEPKRNGVIKHQGDRYELLAKEIRKRGKESITGPEFREVADKLGMTTTSYSHYLQRLVEKGFLKKGKMDGNKLNYIVVAEK